MSLVLTADGQEQEKANPQATDKLRSTQQSKSSSVTSEVAFDLLDTARLAAVPPGRFSLRGEADFAEVFGDKSFDTGKLRFLLAIDREQEQFLFVSQKLSRKPEGNSKLFHGAVQIKGNRRFRDSRKFLSFDDALAHVDAIWPANLPLDVFPRFERHEHGFRRFNKAFQEATCVVTELQNEEADQVRLEVRTNEEMPGYFDTYRWALDSETYQCNSFSLHRSAKGSNNLYYKHEVLYDIVDSRRVPVSMHMSSPRPRRFSDGKIKLGEKFFDLFLKWEFDSPLELNKDDDWLITTSLSSIEKLLEQ